MNGTESPEQWRAIPGHEGMYEVSDIGRVRGLDRIVVSNIHGGKRLVRGRMLKPWHQTAGYPWVTLGGRDKRAIHRLVLLAFVGPMPSGMISRHLNDVKTDNRLSNLQYGSQSQNRYDSVRNGSHKQASQTHCSRGHEFTSGNIVANGNGRNCRACMYGRIKEDQARKDDTSRARGMSARPNTTEEVWLPVAGREGRYSVSDQGRVRSEERIIQRRNGQRVLIRERILRPGTRGGYPYVTLAAAGINSTYDIHRLVVAAFIGAQPPGSIIRHLNGDPLDNWVENLRYATHAEVAADRGKARKAL